MKFQRKEPAQAFRVTQESIASAVDRPTWCEETERIKAVPTMPAFYVKPEIGLVLYAEVGDWIVLENGRLNVMRNRDFREAFTLIGP